MATDSDPSTGLLAIGAKCSAQYCGLVDFLPFKCNHCEQNFCGEHYLPASHKCGKYDEWKHDRVAPSCPLCNTPITVPIGQDPNVIMERHIANDCSVMTGRTKKSTQPHCAKVKCGKVLFAPIRCDQCNNQFCPQHRFPADHTCKTTTTQTRSSLRPVTGANLVQSKPPTSVSIVQSKPQTRTTSIPSKPQTGTTSTQSTPQTTSTPGTDTKARNVAGKVSAKSNAAMAAIKRSMASTKSAMKPTPSSSTPQSPQDGQKSSLPSTSSGPKKRLNPLSPTDRRIKEERKSRRKALEVREKKGLLSEKEKAALAAEKAQGKDRDCLIA